MKKFFVFAVMITTFGTASVGNAQTAADAAAYVRGCAEGNATSCSDAGVSYDKGLGVPVDKARSAEFFDKSCTAKLADSCYLLGTWYQTGGYVPVNLERARRYYEIACAYGSPKGCFYNGIMWGRGQGGSKRLDMARYYLNKALTIDPNYAEAKDALAALDKYEAED